MSTYLLFGMRHLTLCCDIIADYEQVNCESGDDEEQQQQQQPQRQQPRHQNYTSLSSLNCTASTSFDTNECVQPLNGESTLDIEDINEMGTNVVPPTPHPAPEDRKMASNFDKFQLLMWKNFLIQFRHPAQTILEILVPVLFSVILILIRSIVSPDIFSNSTMYHPFHINTLSPLRLV